MLYHLTLRAPRSALPPIFIQGDNQEGGLYNTTHEEGDELANLKNSKHVHLASMYIPDSSHLVATIMCDCKHQEQRPEE